jgi:hypothetical protein
MDIPYKGYTIIPNSERQPDGRWLPVAELEVSGRGVVTSKPPLRAMSREIQATRAEADAAAVKMAKAWIDLGEREGTTTRASTPTTNDKDRSITMDPLPKVPSESEVASPRISQKSRAQDARADAATGVRGADHRTRPTPLGQLDWVGLYQAVGLGSDDHLDRLTRVLMVHFLLDRLVTVVLATKLASSNESNEPLDIENTLSDIASLPISTRVDLAAMLGVVAPRVAESIVEVNRLRNRLVHFKPTRGKPGWDLSDADEIASQDACDKCLRNGIEAVQGLMSALRVTEKET